MENNDLFEKIFKYRTDALSWFYDQIKRLKSKKELMLLELISKFFKIKV